MLRVYAPEVCRFRRPGQFVLVSVDNDYGERIPLTIADADEKEGSITLIFQRVGLTSTLLSELAVGDSLASVLGPLGQPTKIEKLGKVVCVGGGIGVAPMQPIAKALKEAGNEVICILGARNRELIILEDKIRSFADQVIVCTDDGSHAGVGHDPKNCGAKQANWSWHRTDDQMNFAPSSSSNWSAVIVCEYDHGDGTDVRWCGQRGWTD